MKRVIIIATAVLLFITGSCNDGKLTYNEIDFSKTTTVDRCSTLGDGSRVFYKTQDTEALILVANMDDIMRDETVQTIDIEIDGSSTQLMYRKYSDKVNASSICSFPAPAFPTVTQEIFASPGAVLRTQRTVAIRNTDNTEINANHSVSLTYQYNFMLFNVSFQEGSTSIKYDRMNYGTNNYNTNTLGFNFLNNDGTYKPVNSCKTNFISLSDKEVMLLNLSINDLPTTDGEKTIPLSAERMLVFKQYARAGINLTEVCDNDGDIPGSITPNRLVEKWIARNGNIVITTRWTNPVEGEERKLLHTINLQNIVFAKELYENLTFRKAILPFGTLLME